MTFTKEQLQHIIETDHVQCGDASALARMALAGMEAEPVAWAHRLINKRNGVVHPWVYGSAEACPSEGDIFNIEVMPLYTAPPAPVSVPAAMEMDDDFDSAFEHGKAAGWNACRAAMLQSFGNSEQLNSPVIPDGWIPVSERMPDNGGKSREFYLCFGTYFDGGEPDYIPACFFIHPDNGWSEWEPVEDDCDPSDVIITHWMELPAAPQQEA